MPIAKVPIENEQHSLEEKLNKQFESVNQRESQPCQIITRELVH